MIGPFGSTVTVVPSANFRAMATFDTWRSHIQHAHSEADVVRLVQDYLKTWLPSDLEKLPESCRDLSFEDADALLGLAVHLTTCELMFKGNDESRDVLQEIARTFVLAAIRIGQLRPGPFSDLAMPATA